MDFKKSVNNSETNSYKTHHIRRPVDFYTFVCNQSEFFIQKKYQMHDKNTFLSKRYKREKKKNWNTKLNVFHIIGL